LDWQRRGRRFFRNARGSCTIAAERLRWASASKKTEGP
jgi:hypothetical protein